MIRFLAIFFLVYIVFRLIRMLLAPSNRRSQRFEPGKPEEKGSKRRKIIPKDEGEYVDYEDVEKQ